MRRHGVAIYARVSTEEKGQDPENQLRDLQAWCANPGPGLRIQSSLENRGERGLRPRGEIDPIEQQAKLALRPN
jgi:DNA invertase Pin-like site-specific DNA recombinase